MRLDQHLVCFSGIPLPRRVTGASISLHAVCSSPDTSCLILVFLFAATPSGASSLDFLLQDASSTVSITFGCRAAALFFGRSLVYGDRAAIARRPYQHHGRPCYSTRWTSPPRLLLQASIVALASSTGTSAPGVSYSSRRPPLRHGILASLAPAVLSNRHGRGWSFLNHRSIACWGLPAPAPLPKVRKPLKNRVEAADSSVQLTACLCCWSGRSECAQAACS